MPPWDRLSKPDRLQLVQVVRDLWKKALRRIYEGEEEAEEYIKQDTTPGAVVSFEGEGEAQVSQIARGRILYFT